MMRIAFVNMGRTYLPTGRKAYFEPVHLLAMHGVCREKGHASQVHQLGYPNTQQSIRNIRETQPDVLALSFVGDKDALVEDAQQLLQSLSPLPSKIIIGGTDVKARPNVYLETFAAPYGKKSQVLLAKGEGEHLMAVLADNDFDVPVALQHLDLSSWQMLDGYPVVGNLPHIPLDQQSFIRDYSLRPYGNIGQVKSSVGCWGSCFFCSNETTHDIDTKSPHLVREEVLHLLSLGVKEISFAVPNFPADPRAAALIIEALPKEIFSYFFGSRVDSLYMSLIKHQAIWKEYSERRNVIDLGKESSIPARLVWMRKHPSLRQAEKDEARFRYILDFFNGTRVIIKPYLIPFDWSTDLATSILELKRLRGYMVQYRKNLMVFSRVVSQILYREPGSYLAPRMSRIDFFAFERDPRALFLAFLIRSMQHKLTGPLRTALKGAENMATDNLLAFYLVSFGVYCRSVLQSMLVKQFNLKPVLEIIDAETEERTKKVVRAVTKSFLSQLSPAKRTEVQSLFNGFAAAAKERFNKIMQQP